MTLRPEVVSHTSSGTSFHWSLEYLKDWMRQDVLANTTEIGCTFRSNCPWMAVLESMAI